MADRKPPGDPMTEEVRNRILSALARSKIDPTDEDRALRALLVDLNVVPLAAAVRYPDELVDLAGGVDELTDFCEMAMATWVELGQDDDDLFGTLRDFVYRYPIVETVAWAGWRRRNGERRDSLMLPGAGSCPVLPLNQVQVRLWQWGSGIFLNESVAIRLLAAAPWEVVDDARHGVLARLDEQ